jgi:hypothetical protein
MKSFNRKSLLIAGVCALTLTFGTLAYAEKGAETLVRLTKGSTVAPAQVAAPMVHKCATCTDSLVTVIDKATKGPNHAVSQVIRHNCTACSTKIITAGTGKATHDLAMHTCGADVKAACCAIN